MILESQVQILNALLLPVWFIYDSDGARVGFTYHDDAYYYLKNAQGDITGIVDSNLNVVVEYSYDAWGKLLTITGSEADILGKVNPFLYRGYYYDAETGLYYVGSRYYDATTGRYLNSDSIAGAVGAIGTHNMFSYCGNCPINRQDQNGHFGESAINLFRSIGTSISNFAKSIFGASSTTVYESEYNSVETNGGLFSIKTQTTVSKTLTHEGDSSKPISVYSRSVVNAPEKNVFGLKLNIYKSTLQFNLGPTDTGITFESSEGNATNTGSLHFSLLEVKLYQTTAFTQTVKPGYDETTSMDITVNGEFIAKAVLVYGAKEFIPPAAFSRLPRQPVPGTPVFIN